MDKVFESHTFERAIIKAQSNCIASYHQLSDQTRLSFGRNPNRHYLTQNCTVRDFMYRQT